MATCFTSHLAALEINMKQPFILTCCCSAHTAHFVIHFLLAKLVDYQHGDDGCGFSEVSPYTTGHVNTQKESAACPDHSVIQIVMQMAQLGNSLSLQVLHVRPTPLLASVNTSHSIHRPAHQLRQLAFTRPWTFTSVHPEQEGRPSKRAPAVT